MSLGVKFTAPEKDAVFDALDDNHDGVLELSEWRNHIYEDAQNPLQPLREVVRQSDLSVEDLLFKMNLRVWDEPLDFQRFSKALRMLDPSLSNA